MKCPCAKRRKPNLWVGLAAGLAGGLVGTVAMSQYQALWQKAARKKNEDQDARDARREQPSGQEPEPATVRTAAALSKAILGWELTPEQKKIAGPLVHYGFGTKVGGVYGVLAEFSDVVSTPAGLPFGAALWLGADELVIPALGLSQPVTKYPLSTHLYALTAHLVWAATTDGVRRLVRKAVLS